jgi:hypothetical protein
MERNSAEIVAGVLTIHVSQSLFWRNAMKKVLVVCLVVFLAAGMVMVQFGCKKDDTTTAPATGYTGPVYPVTATVLNPVGQPQGGALLTLQNPPVADPRFSAYTDTAGKATIQSPAGAQVLLAKMGTVFQATINVTVAASSTPTNAGTLQLQQNTALKVLVVKASAEQLENVLRAIGFTTFDSTYIDALRDSAIADSTRLLNYLKGYSLVFSDCHGSTEGGSAYAPLSRTYGRYVAGGGKMYGGHYNYYHLQRIWPPYYMLEDTQYGPSRDSLKIVDAALAGFVGFSVASWDSSADSRRLSGYEKFTDLPPGSKVYGTIFWTNPQIAVIVENYSGGGKYLWTDYHNQDIKDVVRLRKIVEYFLYSM